MSEALNLTFSNLRSYHPYSENLVPLIHSDKLYTTDLFTMLAAIFMAGGTKQIHITSRSYTKEKWMTYCTVDEGWWTIPSDVGDILLIYGRTSDTDQSVVSYHVVKRKEEDASKIWAAPFLMLMEGEPPMWINTNPPSST